jgi:hypothetical protein
MSLDTRDKRFSMIGIGQATVRFMQNPTGTIGQIAKAMLEYLYAGILPTPVIPEPRLITGLLASRDTTFTLLGDRATTFSVQAEQATFNLEASL